MNDLESKIKELGQKYNNLSVASVNDNDDGSLTVRLAVRGGPTVPTSLPPSVQIEAYEDAVGSVASIRKESASRKLITLDPMTREDLDLAEISVLQSSPQDLYQRSIEYARVKDIYGSAIHTLANFAFTGFENDIDDPTIKNFFDHWVDGVAFDDVVEKIFFDFFRVGLVCTYKILGKYEPKISYVSPVPGQKPPRVKEEALTKNRFSKSFIPIAYTVLNPTMVEIRGSLMFGQSAIFLNSKAGEEIKEMLEIPKADLSEFQKKILDSLPAPFKKAAKEGKEIPLDPNLVGQIHYRKMPYERYPMPRSARAFEALEFKNELRKADYSTLDGITNYILKITIGDKDHPAKQETLERVSELFDTVSKSFKVVWGHTLNVEKITSPEIGEILGPDKYTQVNSDITAGLAIVRALIDGTGTGSDPAIKLAVKSVIEEINYARRQVQRWIYSEYRDIALAMGFDRIPRVRFNDMALRDELQMMTLIQGMIDRRIISYRTGQKKLGFDPDTEISNLQEELPLVEQGVLGIIGSPYQKSGSGIQPVQGTPTGTPSEGRPKGKKGPTPKPKDQTAPEQPPDPKTNEAAQLQIEEVIDRLSLEEIETLLLKVKASKQDSKKPTRKKKVSPPE